MQTFLKKQTQELPKRGTDRMLLEMWFLGWEPVGIWCSGAEGTPNSVHRRDKVRSGLQEVYLAAPRRLDGEAKTGSWKMRSLGNASSMGGSEESPNHEAMGWKGKGVLEVAVWKGDIQRR